MSTPSQSDHREKLQAAKDRLAEGRGVLKAQHLRGVKGGVVCARWADVLDSVVMALFDDALADLGLESLREHVALVPHGGYGRRDVAPYSDLDLMLLHSGAPVADIKALATRFTQDLYDSRFDVGHSVRTPAEAVRMSRDDMKIYTSLVESRHLSGNQQLLIQFRERFEKMTRQRARRLYESIVLARREERVQYGETVYLLEPNVKRSRGALREIQLLRWVGFTRFGTSDVDQLLRARALSRQDRRTLSSALEFLLRLRNEMHFHADKAEDVLDKSEQLRIAERFGYAGNVALRPVEQFMRDYFRHTSQVRHLVSRFVKSLQPADPIRRVLGPVFSHSVEGDYRVGPRQISATGQGLEKLKSNLDEVLRLADLANLYDKRIDHATWEAVCRAAPGYGDETSDQVAARFLSILAQPARLGELLRRLHELGVLEKIVPAFTHARCLLQFNDYHKFTVDEHSFRAVENATSFLDHPGLVGEVYRGLHQKRTLHLALLLHDLGKGYDEDHSQLGMQIAEATCQRLRVEPQETELIKFLVRHHLMMSYLAFRRNTGDEKVVVDLAVDVGSLEVLQMLFVMTCADLAAVGPGVLNDWKLDVLGDLYRRAANYLADNVAGGAGPQLDELREQVRQLLKSDEDDAWHEAHLAALPGTYLRRHVPAEIVDMLGRLRGLPARGADAWAKYLPESRTTLYTVVVDEGHDRGVFSRLTGALTAQGLEILSAEINSLAGETVLDRFFVHDPDHSGAPPAPRTDEVCRALIDSVGSETPPKFRKMWRAKPDAPSPRPTRVLIDNNTSDSHTIIDVFTHDRTGLLYTIARTIRELRLSVAAARIGTQIDQVVDVFYVTDPTGHKITDPARLDEIRDRLLAAIQNGSDGESGC